MLSLTQLNIFTAVLYCDVEPVASDLASADIELVSGWVLTGVVFIFKPIVATFC
jgi:hypothetical protein